MSEKDKWPCEYCTYENYPAAKRCTLCHAQRPPQYFADIVNEEQDIYKMAATMGQNKESSNISTGTKNRASVSPTGSYSSVSKWPCSTCTYLNWPQTVRCAQCCTPRSKTSSGRASPTTDKLQASGFNANRLHENQRHRNQDSKQPLSPTSAKAKSKHKDANNKTLGTNYAKLNSKWSCKTCTYENWPKATRCIMCGTAKDWTLPQAGPSVQISCSSTPISSPSSLSPTLTLATGGENPSDVHAKSPTHNAALALHSPSNSEISIQESIKPLEGKLQTIRNKMRENDWLWLNACTGVVNGDKRAVEAFLGAGGNPTRQLTVEEVCLLDRPSAFEAGYTLVHLAIRFRREEMLAALLTITEPENKAIKRLPSHQNSDLAKEIRREISSMLRHRKGDFPCYFVTDIATFAMPSGVKDLAIETQNTLFDEILDGDVQKELEEELIINWNLDIMGVLGSRLYALWNRTAGDCLLDSVLQASWGIFDTDSTLRQAMSDSLNDGAHLFYPRWKEYESQHTELLHYSLDEAQWQNDWAEMLNIASTQGAPLEQIHIFALAHIFRRPIIIYGVKYVKSYRGETIGLARFQGIYLPFLWEKGFCWKSPLALGYTRGHFSALVTMEMQSNDTVGAGADIDNSNDDQVAYLPLVDKDGGLLPVHFLRLSEIGREETIIREWLDCLVTNGILVAQQKFGKQPVHVKQMVEDWLDHYRQQSHGANPALPSAVISGNNNKTSFSSDGESDQE